MIIVGNIAVVIAVVLTPTSNRVKSVYPFCRVFDTKNVSKIETFLSPFFGSFFGTFFGTFLALFLTLFLALFLTLFWDFF